MAKQARPVMLQALALILLNWLITPLIVLAERVYTFRYGQKPDAQDAVGEPKLLKPSETANFKLSDTEYNEIKQFVEQKQQSEAVSTVMSVVETKIATVFFADRSIWKDGKMLRLSPSNQ